MKTVRTTVWDPAAYLETDDEIAAYLDDVFSTNDSQLITAAIGDVARARYGKNSGKCRLWQREPL